MEQSTQSISTSIQELENFYRKYGHLYVPPYESFKSLFEKAHELRILRSSLSERQIEVLDKMGFLWDEVSKREQRWFFNYFKLKKFYLQHGHSRVPFRYPNDPSLGKWVSCQRGRKDQLSKEKLALLEEVNFSWSENLERKTWEQMFHKLKNYLKKHRHSQVPYDFPDDPQLGAWAARQRRRKDHLSKEKIALLNKVNFTWSENLEKRKEEKWNQMLPRLKEYFLQHGHSQVPSDYNDRSLVNWVVYLRKNKEKLKLEQIKKLDNLGFVWDMQVYKKTHWDYMFNQLLLFKQKHGHTQVPVRHRNKKLAIWVRAQRLRKHKLTPDKLKKLKDIGFVFSKRIIADRNQRWLANYQKLQEFYKIHGHINVQDIALIKWLYKQRSRKKLENSQRELLEQIGAI